MSTDRRADAATTGVGLLGVAGGAAVRQHGVDRARALRGRRSRFAINDVRHARNLPGGRRASLAYGTGALLGAAATPAALVGAHNLTRRETVAKADTFLGQGLSGAQDALDDRKRSLQTKKPARATAAQLAVGTGGAAAGSLLGHRLMDLKHTRYGRVPVGSKKRAAGAAIAGIGGTLASMPLGRRAVKHYAPGYEMTPTGIHEVKKYVDPDLAPRCLKCGTRTHGPCPVCHEIPVTPIWKSDTVHLGVGRAMSAACGTRGGARRSRTITRVTCPSCLKTHNARSRVSKADLTPSQQRKRVYAAGAAPIVGPVAAGAAAAKFAPPGSKARTARDTTGGQIAGTYAGGAAGALGAAHLANRSPAVMAGSQKITAAASKVKSAVMTKLPQHTPNPESFLGRAGAARAVATGKIAEHLPDAVKAAPAAAAVGWYAGSRLGGVSGQQAGFGHALKHPQSQTIAKAAGMTLDEERAQLRRKRQNARLGEANATVTLAGGGLFASKYIPKLKPATKAKLGRAGVATSIAGAALGGASGFRNAHTTMRDINAREHQIGQKQEFGKRLVSIRASSRALRAPRAGYTAMRRSPSGVLKPYSVRGAV